MYGQAVTISSQNGTVYAVLLVEETGVPGEKHRPVTSHSQTLSQTVVSSTPRFSGNRTHNVSGI
jgi:hypothetical protein